MVGRLSRFLLGGAEGQFSVFGDVILLKEMIPKSYRIPWIFTKTSNMKAPININQSLTGR